MFLLLIFVNLSVLTAAGANLYNSLENPEVCIAKKNKKWLEADKTEDIVINRKVYSRDGLMYTDLPSKINKLDISNSDGSLPELSFLEIVQLRARNCNLREWSCERFPALKILNLSENAIRTIDENVINLQNQQRLDSLDLSYNCLNDFPFKSFNYLRELRLRGNLLTVVNLKKISNISWEIVDLSENRLAVFILNTYLSYANTLIKLNRNTLEILRVKSQSLGKLEIDAELNHLENVELSGRFSRVNLSKNQLKIKNVCLSGTFELLDVSHNVITLLKEREGFLKNCEGNVSINEIDFSFNAIHSLNNSTIFKNTKILQNCEIFHLENNAINSIPSDIQARVPMIKSIFLTQLTYHFKPIESPKKYLLSDFSEFSDDYFNIVCTLLVILNSITVITAIIQIILWKMELTRAKMEEDDMIGFSIETEYIGNSNLPENSNSLQY